MSVNLSPVAGVAGQFFDNNGVPLSGGKLYTYAAGTTTPQATYTNALGNVAHTNPIVLDSAGRVPGGEIWLTDGAQYKMVLYTSASVLLGSWDNIIGINSNFLNYSIQEEVQTATAGQTVFTLATVSYLPGTNTLSVFVDGVNQYDLSSYTETDSTTVTFSAGLHVGALVKFTTAVTLSAGTTDSALVGYLPAGTGAVATTVQAKLRESVSAADYGSIQAAVTAASVAGGVVSIGAGTFALGSTTLTVPSNVTIIGAGRGATNITYSGTGIAVDLYANNSGNISITGISVTCSDDAATGIRLGGGQQHINFTDVAVNGTSAGTNTGTGYLFESAHGAMDNRFSGNSNFTLIYCVGFKYGVRFVGDATFSNRTWTTVSFTQCFLIGKTPPIVGSYGFSTDTYTDLSGCTWIGGDVEGFNYGLYLADSFHNTNSGIEWFSDIENNTVSYRLSTSFQGGVYLNPAEQHYRQMSGGTSNIWMKEADQQGVRVVETYYGQDTVIYTTGAPGNWHWNNYGGPSLVDQSGNIGAVTTQVLVHGVTWGGTFATPEATYRQFGAHKESYATSIPTGGSWTAADRVWNSAVAVGQPTGWICTVAGTAIGTLAGVAITGTAGQFSCTATNLIVGQTIVISGTLGGTGTITGYTNPKTYYVIATNGTTTFTLSASLGGGAVTTTAGTPTGLTYTTAAATWVAMANL